MTETDIPRCIWFDNGRCILSSGHRGPHCPEGSTEDRFTQILHSLDRLEILMTTDAQGLTDEQAAVTALTTVVTDVVTALQALENEVSTLQAQGTVDPAALEAITTSLNGLGTQLNNALPAPPTAS